jgi:ATP-binding cassette, subfamily B, multidrug efflux pump
MKSKRFKKSNDLQLLGRFFTYLRPYSRYVFGALMAIPFSTGATLLVPWLIVTIVDDYITKFNQTGLILMVGFFAGAVLLGYVADAIYTYTLQKAGQLAIANMRQDLFGHSLTLPRTYFDKHPIGITLSRLTSDTEAIGESLAIGVLSLFTDLIKTIALFAFLFYLSWKLALVILLLFPVVYFIVSLLRKKLRYYFNLSRESLASATAFLQECLNGIKTIQLYAAEKKVLNQFEQKNKKFFHSQTRSNIYDSALFSIIDGLTSMMMVLIIWYGTDQIFEGAITIGILIGFINILSKIFIPIREFAQQVAVIQRALSALQHINDLFSQSSEDEDDVEVDPKMAKQLSEFQELRFENVSFKYDEDGMTVLKNLTFHLKKGDRIAIVGATGSGKSTILKLITKGYGNYDGSITINGIELSHIPKKTLLSSISMMQQDVYLFNTDLAFNIALNRPQVDQQKVQESAEYVYAHEFIDQLPDKYGYQIIDNGKNLSAGQAQLVSFARAIAGESELILLDEATSSVDSVTENMIQKAIEKIFQEKTVIAIAHRLSTIRNSDMILVMKEGGIVEMGDHDSLQKQQGYYVELLDKMTKQSA